jgi:hypothetical protein
MNRDVQKTDRNAEQKLPAEDIIARQHAQHSRPFQSA